jgi:hypothetical protein
MNLIQITEQLKNPAVSVQQLMQYANNSNPQVPSYVALAEMQRRQSIQSPPQPPQQTVKDQLGAQLMGLPAAPGAPPGAAPGAAPNPTPNPAPGAEPQQPQEQQVPTGAPQAPMPQPRQPQPTPGMQPGAQPGMAGGGLTSIPLNMHHDFAAGGIIAFAGGGYPEEYAMPKDKTDDEIREEREAQEIKYGISKDPYADVKRRYADIEAKQKESEKDSGYRNVIASLAAMGSGKPRRFGEAMANYAETATNLEKEQQKLSEQNAMKMAELQTLFAERDDARRRGDLVADRAAQDKISEKKKEMIGLRHQKAQTEAQTTSSEASKMQAENHVREQKFKEENYPKEYELERIKALAMGSSTEERILNKLLAEARARDPKATLADVYEKYKTAGLGASRTGVLTPEQLLKSWNDMNPIERMKLVKEAGGEEKARQKYFASNAGFGGGLSGLPTGKPTGSASTMSDAQLKAALGIQ